MPRTLRDRVVDRFWARHSNPKSGWTRVPGGAVLVLAIYRRDPRLLAATLVWILVNPLLFSPPDDEEAWMTRAVLAERWWLRQDNRTVGLGYPNVCNTVAATGFLLALVAAWRRRPAGMAVGTALSVGLKLWWLRELLKRYDEQG
ncbi:hypothetical protein BRC96_04865 [Halobacteriales archaeon QS_6_64_34]|nr:MAG: hypothetical protein BRC96_04865 [Halobacteriales archaeon QS_6_64_34]